MMQTDNWQDHVQYGEQVHSKLFCRNANFSAQLICVAKDNILKPHSAPADACIMLLEGDLLFMIEEKEYRLRTGDVLPFGGGLRHWAKALANSSFLLIK
jgi:quercetin dioxygenase-like cupin family protein